MTKLFVPYEAVIKTASQLSNSIIKDYLNNPQIMQDVMHKIKEYYRDNTFFPTKNPMVYYDTVAQLVKGIKALSVQLNVPELNDVAYVFNNALSQVGPTYGPDTYKDIAENQQHLELIGMIVENVYEALSW